MKYIKIITLSLSLVVLSALAFVGVANAQSIKMGDAVTVAAGQTVDSMLFTGGNNIVIAGDVNGDVYCAGQNITISGKVNGDVACAGQAITISGQVEGSVRLAGQNVTISGIVSNSATIAAQNLTISKDSLIGRDLLGAGQFSVINGQIGRDIVAGSQNLTINGKIGRNISGDIDIVTIGSTGKVNGGIDYTSRNEPTVIDGGKIVGTVSRTAPKETTHINTYSPMAFTAAGFIYMLVSMLIVALTLAMVLPRTLKETAATTAKLPARTILVGAAAMFIMPIIIIILLMTLIGAPLAILLLLAWIIIMMTSGSFAGYSLGRMILKTDKYPIRTMLLGVSILIVTYFIPIVGFITMLIATLFGIGMILIQGKKSFARS